MRRQNTRSAALTGTPGPKRHTGRILDRDVDVFEKVARSDPPQTVGRLDEVVANLTAVFAAKGICENERFRQLTGVHEEARAVDGPRSFNTHKNHPSGEGIRRSVMSWLLVQVLQGSKNVLRPIAAARGWFCFVRSEVTVRARKDTVNYIRVVQC